MEMFALFSSRCLFCVRLVAQLMEPPRGDATLIRRIRQLRFRVLQPLACHDHLWVSSCTHAAQGANRVSVSGVVCILTLPC